MPHLSLLGGAVLEDEAGPVTGRAARPQSLALLALLATAPSGERSRGKLVGLLWPEASESQSRSRLSSCVHRIRSGLDDDALLSVGDDLRLNRDLLTCDIPQFREAVEAGELERAVGLYGGPFLDGFRVKGSPAFDKWMERERDRLAELYQQALETLADRAAEHGDAETAVRWWRERARADPYDSRAARRLMEALAAAGNTAEALRVAGVHEHLLEEELGLEPSPELRELADRLAAGEAEIGGASKRSSERGPDTGSPAVERPDGRTPRQGEVSSEDLGSPGAPSTRDDGAETGREWSGRSGDLVAAVLVLAAVAFGGWYLIGSGGEPGSRAGARSVAVLPFEAIGPEDPGPIADGLHSDLLTRLSRVSGLSVTSATSVERYRDTRPPLPAIADTLGVTWVVEGDVQRADDRIRVNVQLVDTRTDTPAWAESYRRTLTVENLFELQRELAGRIVRSLQTELASDEQRDVDEVPTSDLEAYRLYARGRELLVRRTRPGMGEAEDLFRRAVERDSTFAQAWAGLAHALVLYPAWRDRDPDEVFPPGRRAARRALELNPGLAEAHAALAVVDFYRMRLPTALRRTERAVALEPSFAMGYHGLNLIHLVLGRPEEALTYARRAVALNPLGPENQIGMGWASVAVGDHDRALRAARRMHEIEPDYLGTFLEGYALYRLGQLTEGDTAVAEPARRRLLALDAATSGDPARARELLADLERESDRPTLWTGLLQAAVGRDREALDTFDTVFRRQETSGGGVTIQFRYMFPDLLASVREDPGWDELIRTVNVGWGLNPDGSLSDGDDGAQETALGPEPRAPPELTAGCSKRTVAWIERVGESGLSGEWARVDLNDRPHAYQALK